MDSNDLNLPDLDFYTFYKPLGLSSRLIGFSTSIRSLFGLQPPLHQINLLSRDSLLCLLHDSRL
jgi:hypothetical protein